MRRKVHDGPEIRTRPLSRYHVTIRVPRVSVCGLDAFLEKPVTES
jgi:hypothetical protein